MSNVAGGDASLVERSQTFTTACQPGGSKPVRVADSDRTSPAVDPKSPHSSFVINHEGSPVSVR
ncbi:MAG: hypothetical protein ABJA98_06085 [Acidobacteriota bacterium]